MTHHQNRIKQISILLILVLAVSAEDKPNYYRLLGIPHRSGVKAIKKAFKKFAIKFHPDRAPPGKKEAYQKRFSEVSDAYSLLLDPKKKQAYDNWGHEGLKRLEEQNSWESMQNARQEQHESHMNQNMFQNSDIVQLNVENLSKFYRRIGVWVVLFYRGNEQESKEYKEQWIQFHNKFTGIFTIAVANCEQDEEICEEFEALDTPAVMIFSHDIQKEPERYTGDIQPSKLAGAAAVYLEDYVRVVTKDNFEGFMEDNSQKLKIMLFSNKRKTPAMLKVLSKEFKARVAFGLIKNGPEVKDIVGDMTAPKIFSLGNSVEDKFMYEGRMNKASITNFVRERVHEFVPAEGGYKSQKVVEVKEVGHLGKAQCSSSHNKLCALVLYEKGTEVVQLLEQISKQFVKDPVVFAYMRKDLLDYNEFKFVKNTPEDWSQVYALLIKPKKKKVVALSGSIDSLSSQLEKTMSGSMRFSRFKGLFEDYIKEPDEIDL